jgi:hypothetical protein
MINNDSAIFAIGNQEENSYLMRDLMANLSSTYSYGCVVDDSLHNGQIFNILQQFSWKT